MTWGPTCTGREERGRRQRWGAERRAGPSATRTQVQAATAVQLTRFHRAAQARHLSRSPATTEYAPATKSTGAFGRLRLARSWCVIHTSRSPVLACAVVRVTLLETHARHAAAQGQRLRRTRRPRRGLQEEDFSAGRATQVQHWPPVDGSCTGSKRVTCIETTQICEVEERRDR